MSSVRGRVGAERLDVSGKGVCPRKVRPAVRALFRHVPQVALGDVLPEAGRKHVFVAAAAP